MALSPQILKQFERSLLSLPLLTQTSRFPLHLTSPPFVLQVGFHQDVFITLIKASFYAFPRLVHTPPYLYGMCLLPLTRARITLPRADRERHRGAAPGKEFSLLFTSPPPRTLRSQLPKSSRWRRLRPPDTGKVRK